MQRNSLNENPTIIQSHKAQKNISGINPSQNIITTVPVPTKTTSKYN